LQEIASILGPTQFRLLEQVRLTCLDTKDACKIQGRYTEIDQRILRSESGSPLAAIRIETVVRNTVIHQLDTRILLEPERFVVLGQVAYNSLRGFVPESWSASDDAMLFFVVEPVSE
jgi:hypothetical protein